MLVHTLSKLIAHRIVHTAFVTQAETAIGVLVRFTSTRDIPTDEAIAVSHAILDLFNEMYV